MTDTVFIVGQALAVGLDLQERFPAGSAIHAEAQNVETACRNILRALPFEEAKAGEIGPPPRARLRLVGAPIDHLDV